jgi:hypothetical protein
MTHLASASYPDPSIDSFSRWIPASRSLDQAQADWHALCSEQENWTVPEKQRILAVAFLRYHAAKLADEE